MDTRIALLLGALLGAGGTAGLSALAAPGDKLVPFDMRHRLATGAEVTAASTFAAAIYGSADLVDSVCVTRDGDDWLIDSRGSAPVAARNLPADEPYAVKGEVLSDGKFRVYEREKAKAAKVEEAARAAAAADAAAGIRRNP